MQFLFTYIFVVTKHIGTPGLWIHRHTTTIAKEPQNISSPYLVGASCQSFPVQAQLGRRCSAPTVISHTIMSPFPNSMDRSHYLNLANCCYSGKIGIMYQAVGWI